MFDAIQELNLFISERRFFMADRSYIDGKRILIVDDEPDILDTLEDLLSMCNVIKATNFDEAKEKLETQLFEVAILDIMGVDGYKLLDITQKRDVIAVMLTAHALSTDDTIRSYNSGAASYIPKEEISNIKEYLDDILEAKEQGKHFWWRWLERFGAYYDKKFGPDWQQDDREFWKKIPHA
jgi:CheY-like chemotaxis protein